MNKSKIDTPFTTVGLSLISVIFVFLCLVTFALLSLSTAKANHTIAEQTGTHLKAYYLADAIAKDKLPEIESSLSSVLLTGINDENLIDALPALFPPQEGFMVDTSSNHAKIYYEVAINDVQKLLVELTLPKSLSHSKNKFTITKWCNVPIETNALDFQ